MITLFTFIFVMVITAGMFGGWVVVTIARLVWRGIVGNPRPTLGGGNGRQCINPGCGCENPVHARFCRRCGSNLMQPPAMPRMPRRQARFNPANGRGRQVARI